LRKLRIYLDTSVISYLDQTDSPERMKQTQELWKILMMGKYEIVISDLGIEEINKCEQDKIEMFNYYLAKINYELVKTTDEIEELANEIIKEKILTPKSFNDCEHIASAILSNCDIILSWNFKHIVNLRTITGVRKITFANRYNNIDIYAPYVLLGEKGGTGHEGTKIESKI